MYSRTYYSPADKIMLNVHPQRWFDYGYNWYKKLLMQNVKNVVKRAMLG